MTTPTMTITEAVDYITQAGFAAHWNSGKIWFRSSSSKLLSVGTDYRARVSRADCDTMLRVAREG